MPILATLCSLVLAGVGISSLAVGASPTLLVPSSEEALQIAVPLPEGITPANGTSWQLVEMGQANSAVPVQLVPAMAEDGSAAEGSRRVVATIPPAKAAGTRRFLLQAAPDNGSPQAGFSLVDVDNKSVKLVDGGRPVFVYNYGVITASSVPKNDHRGSRSCYLHPVWGLNGEMLTDDFPKDHYHHHGVFWAWSHVEIAGKEHDLWSQAVGGVAGVSSDIHDQFVRWICREAGPVTAVLAAENGWFVDGKKVMIERVWLRGCAVCEDTRAVDLDFVWIPLDSPVTLRGSDGCYGGLAIRFAVRSSKDAVITVPNGRPSEDQANVRWPWADLTYAFSGGRTRSGAALFVGPGHPDYPPAWLLRHYGPLCVAWPGAKGRTFPPGKPIRLNYRLWIHKDSVPLNRLKRAYEGYVATTKVHWE